VFFVAAAVVVEAVPVEHGVPMKGNQSNGNRSEKLPRSLTPQSTHYHPRSHFLHVRDSRRMIAAVVADEV
jgi:hypothetical protein